MAKVWVLDSETKGTGANVVPLERVLRKRGADAVPGFALPALRPSSSSQPHHKAPHEFKVVDILTREVLGEGLNARTTVDVLRDVRSIVDVTVYVWEPQTGRWRMLTYSETQKLWEYRGRMVHAHRAEVTAPGE